MISLYLTVVIAAFGGGICRFVTRQANHSGACNRSWIAFIAIRATIWPKACWDNKGTDPGHGLTVNDDLTPAACS